MISIIFYSVVLGGLYKIFQIATELSEIKEVLKDIRRNTEAVPAPSAVRMDSHESLMRAVTTASYDDVEREALVPIKPGN